MNADFKEIQGMLHQMSSFGNADFDAVSFDLPLAVDVGKHVAYA